MSSYHEQQYQLPVPAARQSRPQVTGVKAGGGFIAGYGHCINDHVKNM